MRESEMAELLTRAAATDNRRLDGERGPAAVTEWMRAIGSLGLDECVEALGIHRATSTEWLMPAHIAALVHDVVRADQEWMRQQLERHERDVAMVEAMGGTREQWDAVSVMGLGAEQMLLERLQRAARGREVEA